MVGILFDRPVGPYADTKELEYIAALHQTCEEIRQDGSIRAEDIKYYLSSRHGVRVTEEVVKNAIVQELAGSLPIPDPPAVTDVEDGGEEEDEDGEPAQSVIDICQIASLLMIPFLRKGNMTDSALKLGRARGNLGKTNQEGEELQHHQAVVGHVLDVALRNILAELRLSATDLDVENHGVTLTTKLLKQVLEGFGEYDVPETLLAEMIEMAKLDHNDTNQNEVFFNKAAFLHALTGDTQLYDPANIDTMASTHFDDARKAREYQQLLLYGKKKQMMGRRAASQPQLTDEKGHTQMLPFETFYTASNIDNNADTYRSSTWFTLVWVETVLVYFAYMLGTGIQTELEGCASEFGCTIATSLLSWTVIFFQLMLMGLTWVFFATFGNTTYATETWSAKLWMALRLLLGMGLVIVVTTVSFFEESQTPLWNTQKNDLTKPANWSAFLVGLAITGFQLLRLISIFFERLPNMAGGMEKKEKTTKAAASHKVLNMVEHALLLHGDPSSSILQTMEASKVSGSVLTASASLHAGSRKDSKAARDEKLTLRGTTKKALLNFHRMQDTKEETGGIIWFCKKAWDGTIFEQEGIFLHARLCAVNFVQFLIAIFMVGLFVTVLGVLEDMLGVEDDGCDVIIGENGGEQNYYDPDWNVTVNGFYNVYNINETHFVWSPELGFPVSEGQMPKFNGTHYQFGELQAVTICWNIFILNSTGLYTNDALAKNMWIESVGIKPQDWKGAISVGLVAAFVAVLSIACVYIPSFTSSVLKLRSGVDPSLRAEADRFGDYRKSPDNTSSLFGTNFWGCFYTASSSFFLVALITFLILWDYTWPYVKAVFASITGLAITIVIQMVILGMLRDTLYGGFYRKRPAAANIMNVVLECWSLARSAGVVTVRFCKLMVVSALYIGRIDTPMLAPGVGHIGPMQLDTAPNAFKVDLLVHEAHRHPYIERLGLLYLLKLYNGKDFGTRAGAYWRLLFVLALMPWMRNYRVQPVINDEDQDFDDGSISSFRRQIQEEMEKLDRSTKGERRPSVRQLEKDLNEEAFEKISSRNKDLEHALSAMREKVRGLQEEKKALKMELDQMKGLSGGLAAGVEAFDDSRAFSV